MPAEHTGILQPKGFPGLPSGWTSEWETELSSDGRHNLFTMVHSKKGSQGGKTLFVVHGLGEHGGRYLHVPHYVQSMFDRVICPDLLGHGRSEGLRGHVEDFDVMVRDTAQQIRKWGQGSETHALFHSMGGLIGLRALFQQPDLPLASATVCAPFLGIKAKVPLVKKYAAMLLSRILGSLQMSTGVDAATVSHDPEVVKTYQTDRLVHSKMTPRFYTELTKAQNETMMFESGIQVPVQFLVPLQDELVDPDKSQQLYERIKFRDKRLRTYPKFFHEPFNEIGKEAAFEDLMSWAAMHSSSGSRGNV